MTRTFTRYTHLHHTVKIQQKSAGHKCPYCRCDIEDTEPVEVESYRPKRKDEEEEADESDNDDDHEDIELVVKQMAALRKTSRADVSPIF